MVKGQTSSGKFMLQVIEELEEKDVTVAALIHDDRPMPYPPLTDRAEIGDVLAITGDAKALDLAIADLKLELVGAEDRAQEHLKSDRVSLVEAVVSPGARVEGLTVQELGLRSRYNLNLLAISRHGQRTMTRMKQHRFRAGDRLTLAR